MMNNRFGLIGFLYNLKKTELIELAWHLENKTKSEKLSRKMLDNLIKLINYYKNKVDEADKERFTKLGKEWKPVKMEGTARTQHADSKRGTTKERITVYEWMRR